MTTTSVPQPAARTISPRTALGTARLAVGVASLVAPRAAAKTFGVDPDKSDGWLTRLFGSREVVLATALLGAKGPQVRTFALLGAAIDGIDVVSSAVDAGRGRIGTWSAISGGGGAVLFTALGLLAAREV